MAAERQAGGALPVVRGGHGRGVLAARPCASRRRLVAQSALPRRQRLWRGGCGLSPNIVEKYGKLANEQGNPKDLAAWFKAHRAAIEAQPYIGPFAQAAALTILAEYERNPAGLEALGALNRWRGRSAIPLEEYFAAWEASCAELHASADLPIRLRHLLGLG